MRKPTSLALPEDVIEGLARLAELEQRSRSDTASRLLRAGLAKAAEEQRRANLSEFVRVAELDMAPLGSDPEAASSMPDDISGEQEVI